MAARSKYVNVAQSPVSVVDKTVKLVPNSEITLFEPDGTTPLAQTIYSALSGVGTLPNPFTTDAYGNIEFYLVNPQRVKIVATGLVDGNAVSITIDDEPVLPDPSELLVNGMTTTVDFFGDVYVERLGIYDGGSAFSIPADNRVLIGETITESPPFGQTATIETNVQNGTTGDYSALRVVIRDYANNQIHGSEFHLISPTDAANSGDSQARSALTLTANVETAGTTGVENSALRILSGVFPDDDIASMAIADNAILINKGGGTEFGSFIKAFTIDNVQRFRVHGQTTGNDVAGDVESAGRLYAVPATNHRIGVINYAVAPTAGGGHTWGGVWFDTTSDRKALHVAAAQGGVAYRPVLLAPDGGNVGVGITPPVLAAQSGLITTPLQVGGGGTMSIVKAASLVTPSTNFSSLGPKTDEFWYRKTSGGAEAQLLDTATTKIVSQAQVVNTSNQSIADNTVTALAFTSENWDVGAWHDNSTNNNRLTAAVTGRYVVTARATFESNASGLRSLLIRKNGTQVAEDTVVAVNGTVTSLFTWATVDLTAAEYVDLAVYQNSGGALNILGAAPSTPTFDIVLQL